MKPLKQLIPSEVCLKCRICCRFSTAESEMFPVFLKEEALHLSQEEKALLSETLRPHAVPYQGNEGQPCACPFFNPATQECRIYRNRPLDCQLYPFVLTLSPTQKRIFLGLDTQCPFVQDISHQEALLGYGDYVKNFLEEPEIVEAIAKSPGLIGKGEETILPVSPLSGLTEKLLQAPLFGKFPPPSLGLFPLTLQERGLIEKWLAASPREFSEESFVPYIAFSDLLRFYWKTDQDALFIVAEEGNHFFMPIPPIAKTRTPELLQRGFDLLDPLNPQGRARIEGLSQKECESLAKQGLQCYPKSPEYLYRREDLTALAGNRYKSKRSALNYFTTHYDFRVECYTSKNFLECYSLFKRWQTERIAKTADPYELALLEDTAFVHRRILLHAEAVGIDGRIVKIGGEIKGYTFGYALNDETFCIFLEITDPGVKGLPQFLFREFCREKSAFQWINAMDDSGLERLRRVKESYRPSVRKVPYVAARKGI